MKHQGPDPSEALPAGEDALLPEECSRLTAAMFAGEELRRHYFGDPDFANLSPSNRAALEAFRKEAMEELVDSLKQGLIDNRTS